MKSICHVSSAHPRYDPRIFQRMCTYLSQNNYNVSLVVADNLMNEVKSSVSIYSVGMARSRIDRVLFKSFKTISKAMSLDADIYHLHDPELILAIPLLKIRGKKVIFDFHEDYAEQISEKEYSSKSILIFLSFIYRVIERLFVPLSDGLISATPHIDKKYAKFHKKTIDINNYPEKNLLTLQTTSNQIRKNICYVGAISKERGIIEILSAINLIKDEIYLEIAGGFSDDDLEKEAMSHPGWNRVIYHGTVPYEKVQEILYKCRVGLVVLHPIQNYFYSQPTKLLEYMAAGMTVIASNFPFMNEVLGDNSIGYLVDPYDVKELVAAIENSTKNKAFDERSFHISRDLIKEKYNWEAELKKLMMFYDEIILTPRAKTNT